MLALLIDNPGLIPDITWGRWTPSGLNPEHSATSKPWVSLGVGPSHHNLTLIPYFPLFLYFCPQRINIFERTIRSYRIFFPLFLLFFRRLSNDARSPELFLGAWEFIRDPLIGSLTCQVCGPAFWIDSQLSRLISFLPLGPTSWNPSKPWALDSGLWDYPWLLHCQFTGRHPVLILLDNFAMPDTHLSSALGSMSPPLKKHIPIC